jgi:hypothetical protein
MDSFSGGFGSSFLGCLGTFHAGGNILNPKPPTDLQGVQQIKVEY